MITDLLDYGISKDTIKHIKENPSLEYTLTCNIKDVTEIINYLKELNIKDIDNILLYNPDLFIETKKDIEDRFNNKDIDKLVESINDNYENIDLLYE
jgi:hypothetical protein